MTTETFISIQYAPEIGRAGHGDSARSRFGKPDSEIMISYARIERNQFARGVAHSIQLAFTVGALRAAALALALARRRIISPQRIPANHQQFQEHSYPILDDIHFGTRVMRPSHGNFRHPQSVPLRQEQDFGITSEALDPLLF